MKFKVGCKTDIGKKKSNNEDSYYFNEKLGLFGVADGMGGHAGGEVASRLAAETIVKRVEGAGEKLDKIDDIPAFISNIISIASDVIKQEALNNPELRGMGTTIVQALCGGGKVFVTNIGDARCYKLSADGEFSLVSHDQSQIQEYIDDGLITEEQAKVHPMRHVITQAVGYSENLKPRTVECEYRAGDYYLLCSDGLNDEFKNDGEIKELMVRTLAESGGDLDAVCQKLVDTALDLGGRDNVTVMIFKILE
jgi:protein phosphatase